MNRKEVSSTYFLGKILGFFAPMNGGKTKALVDELDRAAYYGLKTRAYNPASNTRERDAIVVNGERSYPAKTVANISELRDDLDFRKGLSKTIDMIAIDEINLFCLSKAQAKETLDFIFECKDMNKALLLSGLLYDFRHMPFGQVHALLPYVDIKSDEKPACMAVMLPSGKPCQNTAQHTQRVWSLDFLKENKLEREIEYNMEYNKPFLFKDKAGKGILSNYVAAPFFDKTVRIEEANDGRVKYLPVCTSCAYVPFEEDTFKIYNAIIRGDKTFGHIEQSELSTAILKFLEEEKWVERDISGVLKAVPFYRNIIGGFNPK